MSDSRETLPTWAQRALMTPIVSTPSSRSAIMGRIRRESGTMSAVGRLPGTVRVPMQASRWRRRGLLSPFGAAALATMLGVMLTVRSLGTLALSRDPYAAQGLRGEATVLGDTVMPSLHDSMRVTMRDTMRIVEFVLHGHALANVAVVGNFNAWQRNATVLARRDDSTWSARIVVPRDVVQFAYVASAAPGTVAGSRSPASGGAGTDSISGRFPRSGVQDAPMSSSPDANTAAYLRALRGSLHSRLDSI